MAEVDDAAAWALDQDFAKIARWQQRTESQAPPPQPGSGLDADDAATAYLQTSHVVTTHLAYAVDHLNALRALIVDAKLVPMGAPFTLLRSAVENACAVVWLLGPDDPRTRALRRLRLALADAKDSTDMSALTGWTGGRSLAQRREDIVEMAARSGISDDELGTRPIGYGKIVEQATEHLPPGRPVLLLWKGCSGITHGRQWALVTMQQMEPEGEQADGVGTYKTTAGLASIASALHVISQVVERAYWLYDRRRLCFREHQSKT
jgi:hypothetical protein